MKIGQQSSTLLLLVVVGFYCPSCQPVVRDALGVDEIEAEELRTMLEAEPLPMVIDNRLPERFEAGHIDGAISLRPEQIDGYLARRGPPRARMVVLVCNRGNTSLRDASTVSAHGYLNIRSLRGGMERWNDLDLPTVLGAAEPIDSEVLTPPILHLSYFEQWIPIVSAFIFKPMYMALSFFLILWLWPRRERGLDLMRYGLISFLVGETFCAVDFLSTGSQCAPFELGHQLGMIGGAMLIPWGLFVLLDQRVFRFTDETKPCVAKRFCEECWKRKPVSCGVHRVMLFVAPVLALVALMPYCVGVAPLELIIPILGSDVGYHYAFETMVPERRVYPLIACLLLLVTAGLLWRGRKGLQLAESFFFVGFGFASFALFRFTVFQAYRSIPVWNDFWEETTELASIAGVGVILFVFRRQLGLWWLKGKEPQNEEQS